MRNMKRFMLTAVLATGLLASLQTQAALRSFEGWKLYNTYCFLCHGTTGKGDGPLAKSLKLTPRNLTDPVIIGQRSDRELVRLIRGMGAHDKVSDMPQWGTVLAEPQVESLVSYIRFLSSSPHGLVGDPQVGQQVYQRYCFACHGNDGKGNGVLSKLLPINPTDHTDAGVMDAMDNRMLKKIILHGEGRDSYMPAWDGILTEAEVDALVSYIRLLSHAK